MQHSVFPVKTEWTQSNLPLLVYEMSFSTHRDGWKEGRYQNLLNILQFYVPVPHSKKSPMVLKCMCMSERKIQVWQLPQWVSLDFTSWVFNCESWLFHANCKSTHTLNQSQKKGMFLFHPAAPNTQLGTESSIQLRDTPKSCLWLSGQWWLVSVGQLCVIEPCDYHCDAYLTNMFSYLMTNNIYPLSERFCKYSFLFLYERVTTQLCTHACVICFTSTVW